MHHADPARPIPAPPRAAPRLACGPGTHENGGACLPDETCPGDSNTEYDTADTSGDTTDTHEQTFEPLTFAELANLSWEWVPGVGARGAVLDVQPGTWMEGYLIPRTSSNTWRVAP